MNTTTGKHTKTTTKSIRPIRPTNDHAEQIDDTYILYTERYITYPQYCWIVNTIFNIATNTDRS